MKRATVPTRRPTRNPPKGWRKPKAPPPPVKHPEGTIAPSFRTWLKSQPDKMAAIRDWIRSSMESSATDGVRNAPEIVEHARSSFDLESIHGHDTLHYGVSFGEWFDAWLEFLIEHHHPHYPVGAFQSFHEIRGNTLKWWGWLIGEEIDDPDIEVPAHTDDNVIREALDVSNAHDVHVRWRFRELRNTGSHLADGQVRVTYDVRAEWYVDPDIAKIIPHAELLAMATRAIAEVRA